MKLFNFTKIGLVSILFSPVLIYGNNLTPPTDLNSTKTLPKGVRNFRMKGLMISANDKYDNYGQQKLLADPFFSNISFEDMVDPTGSDPMEKGQLLGYLQANDINLNDSIGKTNGALSIAAQVSVPVLAYGITDSFTIGIAFPIVNYTMNVETGFLPSENTKKLYQQLKEEGKIYEANKMREKLIDPIGTKLSDYGYEPLTQKKGVVLGDIKVVGKYLLFDDKTFSTALKPELSLPTGPKSNPNSVLPTPGANAPLSFGLSLIQGYSPLPQLDTTMSVGITKAAPRYFAGRVPYQAKSKLTPDIDYNIKHNSGTKVQMEIGSKYQFLSGFSFLASYHFQYKEKDRFYGNFKDARSANYKYLEVDTRQRLESFQASLGFNTLGHYKNKAFPLPFEVSINHIRSSNGKNVAKDPLTTLELALFF